VSGASWGLASLSLVTAAILPTLVHAIVVDTNTMPRGRLSVARLHEMVDVVDKGDLEAEIWIPEPMVWEWAEHTFSDVQQAWKTLEDARKRAKSAGFESGDPAAIAGSLSTINVAVAHIEKVLSDIEGVRILRLADHPEAAVGGLRDQTLLQGAGRRKKQGDAISVKAGAADSASLRLVELEGAGKMESIVLLSGDADADRHFDLPGKVRPAIIKTWNALRNGLLDLEPAEEALRALLESSIPKALVNDEPMLAGATVEGAWKAFGGAAYMDRYAYLDYHFTLTDVASVSAVEDIEVDLSGGYGSATVIAQVHVDMEGAWWNAVDDRLEHEFTSEHFIPAELQVSLKGDASTWDVTVEDVLITGEPMSATLE
jgi:hypothetical protein